MVLFIPPEVVRMIHEERVKEALENLKAVKLEKELQQVKLASAPSSSRRRTTKKESVGV